MKQGNLTTIEDVFAEHVESIVILGHHETWSPETHTTWLVIVSGKDYGIIHAYHWHDGRWRRNTCLVPRIAELTQKVTFVQEL